MGKLSIFVITTVTQISLQLLVLSHVATCVTTPFCEINLHKDEKIWQHCNESISNETLDSVYFSLAHISSKKLSRLCITDSMRHINKRFNTWHKFKGKITPEHPLFYHTRHSNNNNNNNVVGDADGDDVINMNILRQDFAPVGVNLLDNFTISENSTSKYGHYVYTNQSKSSHKHRQKFLVTNIRIYIDPSEYFEEVTQAEIHVLGNHHQNPIPYILTCFLSDLWSCVCDWGRIGNSTSDPKPSIEPPTTFRTSDDVINERNINRKLLLLLSDGNKVDNKTKTECLMTRKGTIINITIVIVSFILLAIVMSYISYNRLNNNLHYVTLSQPNYSLAQI